MLSGSNRSACYGSRVRIEDSAPAREPDLTLRAIVSGLVVGALLCIANLYMGLKTGIWDGGQITASVLALALVSGRLNRLENNVAQTAACAVGGIPAAAGLLGAVPALQLLGVRVPGWGIALWGLALGVVGVLLALALRRRLLEEEDLPFPTGIATAEVIEALHAGSGEGRGRTRALLGGGIAAAIVAWFRGGKPTLIPESLALPGRLAGVPVDLLGIGLSTSPLLWGVGILVGPRVAIGMLTGSVLGWIVLGPWLVRGPLHVAADRGSLSNWLSWPATALMVGAALVFLINQAGMISGALRDLRSIASDRSRARLQGPLLAAGAALGTVVVGKVVFDLSPLHTVLALLLSILGSSVCARSAGLTDFSPLGTVGQATQAAYGALAPGQPVVNVAAGSVVAGAATETSMLLWSLKTGRLLRAPVAGQAAAALAGCVVGAVLCMPAYGLLVRAYGLTSPELPMPTALQWKAMGEVVAKGLAALPPGALHAVVVAGAVGIVLAIAEESRVRRFVPPAVAVGLGVLLPLEYSLTISCGAALVAAGGRFWRWRPDAAGVAGAGLIAGDALVGIAVALLRSFGLL
jgi:putative OPT family oligopeptide transporter